MVAEVNIEQPKVRHVDVTFTFTEEEAKELNLYFNAAFPLDSPVLDRFRRLGAANFKRAYEAFKLNTTGGKVDEEATAEPSKRTFADYYPNYTPGAGGGTF